MIYLYVFLLTILQNASYTLISRARNSDSLLFHAFAATCSNGMWILVMSKVIKEFDNIFVLLSYLVGSVIGSVLMHWLSMNYLEKLKIFNKKKKDEKQENK